MQEWFEEISRDTNNVYVQLKNVEYLDTEIFERMSCDEFCLPCVLRNQKKGILMYSISSLVTLDDFLKQYVFEKEEGYYFLIHLLEQAIACNRNKPILLDPNYIFVSGYGDQFYFIVAPVKVSQWMFNQDMVKEWIEYLYKNFNTSTAFEINGYLIRFLSTKEFSLSNCILGLKNIQRVYYPKRFFLSRKPKPFRVSEPIHPIYSFKETKQNEDNEKTTVLGFSMICKAYLSKGDEKIELKEETLIGRSSQCELRIHTKDVSLQHAKISMVDQRYYIQDLKSSNGTYLNEKRIQRKMRLRNGMKIRFANQEYVFNQNDH